MGDAHEDTGHAGFLFCRPSWLDGLAGVFDLSGKSHVCYNTSTSASEADARALRQDWLAVGDDMRSSLRAFERELSKK